MCPIRFVAVCLHGCCHVDGIRILINKCGAILNFDILLDKSNLPIS
jgi:hypothetical protein